VTPMLGNQNPIPYLEIAHANDWMQLLYDHLVGCTPEGKYSTDLGLANKWAMSPDGLTWTFSLRKGVKFHDGVEVTAKDVKFSIERFMLPDALSDDAAFIRENVKSIEATDPYTVTIHCKQRSLFLPSLFNNMEATGGMVIPKDYYERVGKDAFSKHPIGSGPYKWHSQQIGSFIKLEAIDKHWRDGIPKYKYMTYLLIPEENTRIAMLRTGEADIARLSRDGVKEAVNAGLNVITKDNGGIVVFYLNQSWTSPIFLDIRFRKALNLAIDKEAIIKQLCGGLAKPLATYPGQNISAVGGNLTLKPYPYDPQEARRLIKEGGWEGHEFTMVSFDRAGFPELPQVVEALAGYWQKIGLKPKIAVSEWAVWRRARFEPKSQNMVYGTDDSVNADVGALIIKFIEKFSNKSKLSTVNIPELNQKIDRIEKSMDISEISRLMAEIYQYAYDNYLMIPICETFVEIATTKRIPKWDPGLRRNDRNYYDLIRQK
jgi:peptide/nickel transport system substrate-binding protein